MPGYRMKCRKCSREYLRQYSTEEFDRNQYGSSVGWSCFDCGYPRMVVMKSNQQIKDKFEPGYQRNIGEYCSSYSEYKAKLKEKGLIEIGYEEIPETKEKHESYWTPEILRQIHNEFGVKLSGNEIKELENGDFS